MFIIQLSLINAGWVISCMQRGLRTVTTTGSGNGNSIYFMCAKINGMIVKQDISVVETKSVA